MTVWPLPNDMKAFLSAYQTALLHMQTLSPAFINVHCSNLYVLSQQMRQKESLFERVSVNRVRRYTMQTTRNVLHCVDMDYIIRHC